MKPVSNANIRSWAISLYREYAQSCRWKSFDGFPLPDFNGLSEDVQKHWLAVAKYVIEVINL